MPHLDIKTLAARHHALTPSIAADFYEAACVSLHRHHASPQTFDLNDEGDVKAVEIEWEEPDLRPLMRKYTVRSLDLAAGTLDIDFVLHEDAGPGSDFAARAVAGDLVGVVGPGGGGLAAADWYLFAGDETALPAIARMLEALPAEARGHAFLEVADAAEVQPLAAPPGIAVAWLLRDGKAAGTTTLLIDAVRATAFPAEGERVYLWAGCEFEAFRAIRAFARQEKRLSNSQHLVVSYWRRGTTEAD